MKYNFEFSDEMKLTPCQCVEFCVINEQMFLNGKLIERTDDGIYDIRLAVEHNNKKNKQNDLWEFLIYNNCDDKLCFFIRDTDQTIDLRNNFYIRFG